MKRQEPVAMLSQDLCRGAEEFCMQGSVPDPHATQENGTN
jgi:hypothetical protein